MDLMFIPRMYSALINPPLRGPPGGWIPSGLGEDCLWNKLTGSGEVRGGPQEVVQGWAPAQTLLGPGLRLN